MHVVDAETGELVARGVAAGSGGLRERRIERQKKMSFFCKSYDFLLYFLFSLLAAHLFLLSLSLSL